MCNRRLYLLAVGLVLCLLIVIIQYKFSENVVQLQNFSQPYNNNTKVEVEIYYEVLCPDSRHFIVKQFMPTYEKFQHRITAIFIPFGKATKSFQNGLYKFECQHGEPECQGNKLHACAIKYIQDESLLSQYISCMILSNRFPEVIAKDCAKDLHVDELDSVLKCWRNEEGNRLLFEYGEMTHTLQPPVSFIPTIVIQHSQGGQAEILRDFKGHFCRNYAATCDKE